MTDKSPPPSADLFGVRHTVEQVEEIIQVVELSVGEVEKLNAVSA